MPGLADAANKLTRPVMGTAAWSTPLPQGYMRIGVSRGPVPKGIDINTLRWPALIPHVSSRTDIDPALFHKLYLTRLAYLDPEVVFHRLLQVAGMRTPVLCAHPDPREIASGRTGCHRHLVADWFERALDIKVPEIGAPPSLDRFRFWRMHPPASDVPGHRPTTFQHLPITDSNKSSPTAKRMKQLKLDL